MAIDYDRGPNDLEETIDRLEKQKKYLQKQVKKADRTQEIMALYAEVKRLKNENEILQINLHKMKNFFYILHIFFSFFFTFCIARSMKTIPRCFIFCIIY